jgi:predicted NBD/HSP70 family sugar kinase
MKNDMRFRASDQYWVREHNVGLLLNYLWDAEQPTTRPHLTKISGLNKSTVGSLLEEMKSWQVVIESGKSQSRTGRPGTLLSINADGGRILGLEIAVGFLTLVMTDLRARVLWRRQISTTEDNKRLAVASQSEVLGCAERLIAKAILETDATKHTMYGIGVVMPGLVDREQGTLLSSGSLGWGLTPIGALWKEHFGLPVVLANEAKASALAERMAGVAKGIDNFLYLSAGRGLGGGLVLDGKVYGGEESFAGEIGHVIIDPDGPQCSCGSRGCWEQLVGVEAVFRRLHQAVTDGRAPKLLALVGKNVDSMDMHQILEAAQSSDQGVLDILDDVGRVLGIGIVSLTNVLNPKMIVFGGELSLVAKYVLPRARKEVKERGLAATRSVDIQVSAFQFDASVMGAVALILREFLDDPVRWRGSALHLEVVQH